MMELLRSCKLSKQWLSSCNQMSRVSKVALFFSTKTTNTLQKPHFSKNNDSLYKRISPVGDPNVSIIPIVEQWEKEGKTVRLTELTVMMKSLRKFNRYSHALELSELMGKRRDKLSPAGVAVHLDLLSRAQGVEKAEKYFDSIPDHVKDFKVYGALLNCYAFRKSVEKAEATAERMRQMGMMNTLSYNCMLNLYKNVGDIEKLEQIVQEMRDTAVPCDKQTYGIRLSVYANASYLEEMERLLKEIEESSGLCDWYAYTIASGGYIKSGLVEKALEMLQKSEKYIQGKSRGAAWENLLHKYAVLGRKEDVYRIWDSYKKSWSKIYNRGYLSIIGALVTLDDIEGAEKLYAEWESANLTFDFKIPNLLINSYCTKGLLEKAEACVGRVMDMGKQPPASTLGFLATAYARDVQMEKAVEKLKQCAAAADKRWFKLDEDTLTECVEYLKVKGDLDVAEDIKRSLQDNITVSSGEEISEADKLDEMEESCQ